MIKLKVINLNFQFYNLSKNQVLFKKVASIQAIKFCLDDLYFQNKKIHLSVIIKDAFQSLFNYKI